MIKKFKIFMIPIFLIFLSTLVSAYEVRVAFYQDLLKTVPYSNEFLWIYLQNRTFQGGELSYNATCFRAPYHNGNATITDVPLSYYDVFAVDGAISWSNETNCPSRVDNYNIWATAQSNILIDNNKTLEYFINTTMLAPPRQYFWNMMSFRAIMSIIAWLVILSLIIVVAYWTKSGMAVLITAVILVIIKLLIGL